MASVEKRYSTSLSKREQQGQPSRDNGPVYLITDADTEFLARQALESVLPLMNDGLWLLGYEIRNIGPTQWEASVAYGLPGTNGQQQTSNPFELATFSTSGGTAHASYSKGTRKYPSSAASMRGAIGVTKTTIEGVDVISPKLEFTLNRVRQVTLMTNDFVKMLARSTGKTNLYPWLTFERGELLFLGAEGSVKDTGEMAIGYRFAASENAYNLEIGDPEAITVEAKRGWEYLWVRSIDTEDATNDVMIKKPRAVYVEQVYDELDFTILGAA